MNGTMPSAQSPQNVRAAARSRLLAAPPDREPSPQVWLPTTLKDAGGVKVLERSESVPAEPAAAAELGSEVRRLRGELARAKERAIEEAARADRAEQEVARLNQRIEAMKRAAAKAAAEAHPAREHGRSR